MSQATSVILAWLSLGLMSAGAAPSKVPHGDVELVPAVKSIESGAPVTVGLLFHLEEGWHIYWKNPGDSGQPPRLKWELPRGMTAGAIEWPTPKRLPVGPLLDYGYEKTVLLPIPIQTESDLAGPQELKAGLRVLVCRETCMPGKADLSLTLPVAKRTPAANPQYSALFAQTLAEKPSAAPANWQVNAKQSGTQFLLSVKGAPKEASLSYIPAEANVIRNAAAQKNAAGPNGQTLRLERADGATGKVATLSGLLLVKQGGRSEAYEISSPVTGPAATVDRTAVESAPLTQGRSLFAILLLAFGGGLILNLMPCVFPVLSIKVLSLLEHYGGERKTVQLSGLLYTAGVLASFWALVGVLLSLRGAGRNLGWGFQLQSPGFVAFLICLLFGLGLSLAGVFEIGASVMNTGSSLTQRGTYSSSFFTGVLATVVATPCTAPLMGVAVGFALAQSAFVCLVIFTSMALGLAAPFLVLSLFPSLSRFLPRPGAWMETLKQAMAFLLFASVIWLLWVLGQQVGMDQLAGMLFALLVLAVAGWMAGRWPTSRVAAITAAVIALGTVVVLAAALKPVRVNAALETAAGGLKWEPFTPQKLADYRASGKPVLVDFTAAWCLTCQVNDRVVFHSPEVEQRLNRSDITLLRADWTSYDPAITDTLAKYGRSGIPFYVIYAPSGNGKPVTLPDGLLSPSGFLETLDRLKI